MRKEPVILSWSGGKDSSYTLNELLHSEQFEVKYLLSTFNGNYKRHARAARAIAREIFEAEKVLASLLERAGV